MSAKFVMLPSSTGSFIIDANRVVSAREADGGTAIVTTAGMAVIVALELDRVRDILGTLRLEAKTEDQVAYFNHRLLDFVSIKDGGLALLSFEGMSAVKMDEIQAETMIELLGRLESEMDQS